MKKIKYSELQSWRKQCIKEKVDGFALKRNDLAMAFESGLRNGFDEAINVLRLHGYIETDFQN